MPETRSSPLLARRKWGGVALSALLAGCLVAACTETGTTTTAQPQDTSAFTPTTPATTSTTTTEPDELSEELARTFDRIGELGELRIVTAEVSSGSCQEIAGMEADQPAPIGSVVQIYVLAALAEAVSAGGVDWDEPVVVEERLKSVPPGSLQDRSEGDTVTVFEAAEMMTTQSDNTATDHLIDHLGRDEVSASMEPFGHTSGRLNTPLLNTRELAALKVGPASGLRIQWLQGDEESRRSILDQISDITPEDVPVRDWLIPVDPDQLAWFASPVDLCELAVGLIDLTDGDPRLASILEANGEPAGPWDRTWAKLGEEPGLLAVWFVTRTDGRTFVTAGSVVNPDSPIDEERATHLFAEVRDALAP